MPECYMYGKVRLLPVPLKDYDYGQVPGLGMAYYLPSKKMNSDFRALAWRKVITERQSQVRFVRSIEMAQTYK